MNTTIVVQYCRPSQAIVHELDIDSFDSFDGYPIMNGNITYFLSDNGKIYSRPPMNSGVVVVGIWWEVVD